MIRRVPTALNARCIGKGVPRIPTSKRVPAGARSLSAAAAPVPANERLPTALNRRRLSLVVSAATEGRRWGYQAGRGFSSEATSTCSGFDPFTTHHNAEDAERADRMVRDLVKRRLAGGAAIEIREGFLRGALNSYRVLSEKAAEQARRGKRRPDASFTRKADDLLAFVEKAYEEDPALSPGIKSYNMLVNAYAGIGDPEGAEAVSRRLQKLWEAGNAKLKPDTILYGAVIDAWAKSRENGATQRAEAILEHMEQLHQQGHEGVCPNVICFNTVINAWAKSREKGAALRAEAILNHMLELHEGGREGSCPNTRSFNTVINAWAKSRENGAAQRAEAILNHMLKLHESGREGCCPDTTSFTAVIDAWARSREKDAPKRAEALLERMEKLHGQGYENVCSNVISYNAVINAWAKSREKGAAQRAGAILNHLLKLHESGREGCCPNTTSFTAAIDAWARSRDKNAYEHAKRVFAQMQEMEKVAEPNVLSYNSLINALSVSSVPDKAEKAFNMLLEMETIAAKGNKDVAPTSITFGAVMKACARTSGNQQVKRKALRVALGVCDKLRRSPHLSIDPRVYDPLFTTIANASVGQEYIKLVSEVFKFCCEDGALDDFLLRNLRRRAPKDVFGMLVGRTGNVEVSDLPRAWSRNSNNKARR